VEIPGVVHRIPAHGITLSLPVPRIDTEVNFCVVLCPMFRLPSRGPQTIEMTYHAKSGKMKPTSSVVNQKGILCLLRSEIH
jgi:hypothetical protein